MDAFFIYVTVKDRAEAKRIAQTAVEERLAACANILGPIESLYRWEGEICESEEVALVLKTSADRQAELTQHIKQLHSYECPCIASLPITGGNPDFLEWIAVETKSG